MESWLGQPSGSISSGIHISQIPLLQSFHGPNTLKGAQENISNSLSASLPKSKAQVGQENSFPFSTSQAYSRPQDRQQRRPFSELSRSEATSGLGPTTSSTAPYQQAGYFSSTPQTTAWTDIDELNKENIIACSEYANTIFDHLWQSQESYHPDPCYLQEVQTDITAHMRSVLVDWLIEVSEEYKLCSDTLWLTFNFLDRFLSKVQVSRGRLQLAGVAAMWVAAKYEEIYAPNSGQFCYITDNTYSKEQLAAMEEQMLAALDFRLTAPTVKTFLRRFLQACVADEKLHYLASYIAELSLLDTTMLQFLPSEVAAAAVYLARCMLRSKSWNATLEHYSQYKPAALQACAEQLLKLHQQAYSSDDLVAVKEKYGGAKFQQVSRIPPLQFLPPVQQ